MKTILPAIGQNIFNNHHLFTAAGLEPIQHIDLFFNQYENPENFETFDTPALFIEFGVDTQDSRKPTPQISLTTHLVVHTLADTRFVPGMLALSIFEYQNLLKPLLLQTKSNEFSKLKHLRTEPLMGNGALLILKENYTAQLYEADILPYVMKQGDGEDVKFGGVRLVNR